MEQMTEYERKRLENVQRNQEMLAALRVHDTAQFLRSVSKKPKLEPKGYKPPKREKEPELSVLRRSLRTRGLSPESIGNLGSDSPPAKPRKGLIAPSPGSSERPRSSKEGPLSFAETYVPSGEVSYDHYLNRIRELSDHAPLSDWICAKPGSGLDGGGHVGPKFRPEDLKLEAKDIARVASTRIFSVHFLPCKERVIVASGDREGHLSLWDADCEEEEGNGLHMYRPHARPVSGIATAPFSVEKERGQQYDGNLVNSLLFY